MYSKSRDPLFEVQDRPPMPHEGNMRGSMKIVDDESSQAQQGNMTGTIVDWFDRSAHIPVASGVIRAQFNGGRFQFTERDVLSGEPKVGHKVSFAGHPAGGLTLPPATKVVVEELPEQLAQEVSEEVAIDHLMEKMLQPRQLPEQQSYEYPSQPKPQAVEMVGTITQYNGETNTGIIHAAHADFMFYGSSIARGFAEIGKSCHFRSVDNEFATEIEIS